MGLFDTATRPLREAARVGTHLAGRGTGLVHRLRGSAPKDLDDVTIARKVESEIFRSPSVPKGRIDVNVVDGVVYLRGTAKNPSQVKSIAAKARSVPEVREVQNLLHLPKTPAPTRTDAPRAQRKTRRSGTKAPARPRTEAGTVNADKIAARDDEQSPTTLAQRRQGRQPAKLGATGGEGETEGGGS
jgi:hypothetical protein